MTKPRTCGRCSVCCYRLMIPELQKPAGKWCAHCTQPGCAIYGDHPPSCKAFRCGWLDHPEIPDCYRPDRSGVLVGNDPKVPFLWVENTERAQYAANELKRYFPRHYVVPKWMNEPPPVGE